MVILMTASPHAQAPRQPATVFRSGTELVLVNVVVRDKSGAVVRGLTRDDFAITEDDKPQTVTSFDFEELDKADAPSPAGGAPSAEATQVILPRSRPRVPPTSRPQPPRRRSTCADDGSLSCSST